MLYVKNLFKTLIAKDIAVVGITDYFTIDGYKRLKGVYLANDKKLQALFSTDEIESIKKILVLPNIEFRSDIFVGSNSLNFHILFSDLVSVKDIEEKFLHEIDFLYQGEPQAEDKKRKLKEGNLIELGAQLKSEHAEFQESDVYIGMMNAVVDHKQISKILSDKESMFGGKCVFVVVADEDLSDISWNSRDHLTRKVLVQKSDLLFTSNGNTRKWALGRHPYKEGVAKFIVEFKTLKPCIHGSDAHEAKVIGHPCAKRGDPLHGSTPLKSSQTIDEVCIKGTVLEPELGLKETHILLNEGFVAVTGGKGGGKTALVDLIANIYEDRAFSKDKNSFAKRISENKDP